MWGAQASSGGGYPPSVADAGIRRGRTRTSATVGRPLLSLRMTDDPIRTLLASLTPAPFIWSREGTVVIMDNHVQDAGGDSDAVGEWVEAHGGEIDRTLPVVATRRGVTAIPKPVGKRYYVVPESALGD
jgi:hypothetical protein